MIVPKLRMTESCRQSFSCASRRADRCGTMAAAAAEFHMIVPKLRMTESCRRSISCDSRRVDRRGIMAAAAAAARQEQAKILYAVRGYSTGRRSASEFAGCFRKADCENGQPRICSSIWCGHCTAADCASEGGSDEDVCVSSDEPNVSRYAAAQTEQGVYPLRESDCGSAWIVSRFSSRI